MARGLHKVLCQREQYLRNMQSCTSCNRHVYTVQQWSWIVTCNTTLRVIQMQSSPSEIGSFILSHSVTNMIIMHKCSRITHPVNTDDHYGHTLPKVQSSQHSFFCWNSCLKIIGWFNRLVKLRPDIITTTNFQSLIGIRIQGPSMPPCCIVINLEECI